MNGVFQDSNGNISSKRIFGAVAVIAGLIAGYIGAFRDVGLVVEYSRWVIGFGAAILGLGVFEKMKA
jgi:hypothetical protein